MDFYQILEVGREASSDEIKKSYRRLALKYHPDKNPGDTSAEAKFKQINEAYETLGDPSKKKAYDSPKWSGPNQANWGSPFADFFNNFNSANSWHQHKTQIRKGKNINARLQINLADVLKGAQKKVTLFKRFPCEPCKGTGAHNAEVVFCVQCN